MSHFVCGKLSFSVPPWEGEEAFFFELQRAAAAARINLVLGCNIAQTNLPDIIGATAANEVPFLMTDSPISDVSEALIAPDAFTYGEEKCRAMVEGSLGRIRDVVATALANKKVESVTVAVSYGEAPYDDYEKLAATAEDFVEIAMSRFTSMIDTPYIHILVRRV